MLLDWSSIEIKSFYLRALIFSADMYELCIYVHICISAFS